MDTFIKRAAPFSSTAAFNVNIKADNLVPVKKRKYVIKYGFTYIEKAGWV
jgi:hypothetical protein